MEMGDNMGQNIEPKILIKIVLYLLKNINPRDIQVTIQYTGSKS